MPTLKCNVRFPWAKEACSNPATVISDGTPACDECADVLFESKREAEGRDRDDFGRPDDGY